MRTQLASSRASASVRPPSASFSRSSCTPPAAPAASAAQPTFQVNAQGIKVPSQEEVRAIVARAKTCAKPDDYIKCVVNNYAIAASGVAHPPNDCEQRCKPVKQ